MAHLSETAAKNQRYNILLSELLESIPALELQAVRLCGDDGRARCEGNLTELVADLDELSTEANEQGNLIIELQSCGEDLIEFLNRFDCQDTPKVHEMQRSIRSLSDRYDLVQDSIGVKQQEVETMLTDMSTAQDQVEKVFVWITIMEKNFENSKLVSLDRDTLDEQVREHRGVEAEIEEKAGWIQTVVDEYTSFSNNNNNNSRLKELLDRYEGVLLRSQVRSRHLAGTIERLVALQANIQHVDAWLTTAVASLRTLSGGSAGRDRDVLRSSLENIYRRKTQQQLELDALERTGKELISDPLTGDKIRLRETLADVRDKWRNLTDLIVQMLSTTVSIDSF